MDILCTHIWQISWYFVLSQKSQIRRENIYSLKFRPEKYRKKELTTSSKMDYNVSMTKKNVLFLLIHCHLSRRIIQPYHYNYYEKRREAKKECIISLIFHAWCMNNKNTHNLQITFFIDCSWYT